MLLAHLSRLRIALVITLRPTLGTAHARRAYSCGLVKQKPPVSFARRGTACRLVMAGAHCPEPLPHPPQLQRDLFCETLHLKALRIPKKECQKYTKLLAGYTLDKPRLRSILAEEGRPDTRLLLLNERVQQEGLEDIRSEVREQLPQDGSIEVLPHELTLDYSYWTTDQILKRLLPEGCEVPSSYEAVGHIAHVNLRDELLPYKHVIAQVLLDKNPAIRTVVNKVGTIENEYRVFSMEVLAGEPNLETQVKQHAARFRLNYGEVYWNSRLEAEHKRLTDSFWRGQVVVDMMAGIGPFAIPAAQRGCTVYANDLNPRSHHWLLVNIKLNKVSPLVKACCMDGRAFLRLLCGRQPQASASSAQPEEQENGAAAGEQRGWDVPEGGLLFDHVVMNLPASAIEFLDAFGGCFDQRRWEGRPLPTVHCYTFAPAGETDTDISGRVEGYLGGPLSEGCRIHMVRDVAPNKRMFCLSFRLPVHIAFGGGKTAAAAPAAAALDAPVLQGGHSNGGCGHEAAPPAEGSQHKKQKIAPAS